LTYRWADPVGVTARSGRRNRTGRDVEVRDAEVRDETVRDETVRDSAGRDCTRRERINDAAKDDVRVVAGAVRRITTWRVRHPVTPRGGDTPRPVTELVVTELVVTELVVTELVVTELVVTEHRVAPEGIGHRDGSVTRRLATSLCKWLLSSATRVCGEDLKALRPLRGRAPPEP